MKKNQSILFFTLILLFVIGIGSCCKKKGTTGNIAEIIEFDIPFSDSGNIPTLPFVPPLDVPSDSFYSTLVPTYADSLFKKNNSTPNKVISVKAVSMIISGFLSTQKIDFMKSVQLFISDKNGSNKILLGSKADIPLNATNVNLDLTNAELKSYIIADTFRITLGGTIRANTPIAPGSALNFTSKFHVVANP